MKLIPLTRGKVAIVDDADFEAVNAFKWYACKRNGSDTWYACRQIVRSDGSRHTQYMHQFLMPDCKQIDHRYGDGLDNRREYIRPATHRQNGQGYRKLKGKYSKFRGVSWHKQRSKWNAKITINGNGKSLGLYISEIEAAKAYDAAARKYFGDRASPNFPI